MISTLTQSLIRNANQKIEEFGIRTVEEGRRSREKCIRFDPEVQQKNAELKAYLFREMYAHYRVVRMEQKARRVLTELFRSYTEKSEQLPPHIFSRMKGENPKRVVCDYIAGMTDRYAMEEYRKLFDPMQKV